MKVLNITNLSLFKINGQNILINYHKYISGLFDLCFEGENTRMSPNLYVYKVNGKYLFGEYIDYRNEFTEIEENIIKTKIYEFMLKKCSNLKL